MKRLWSLNSVSVSRLTLFLAHVAALSWSLNSVSVSRLFLFLAAVAHFSASLYSTESLSLDCRFLSEFVLDFGIYSI